MGLELTSNVIHYMSKIYALKVKVQNINYDKNLIFFFGAKINFKIGARRSRSTTGCSYNR